LYNSLVPPLITSETADHLRVNTEDEVALVCSVSGTPQPFVLWVKNNVPIYLESNNLKLLNHNQTLVNYSQLVITFSCYL
jgi:hypothetical protein